MAKAPAAGRERTPGAKQHSALAGDAVSRPGEPLSDSASGGQTTLFASDQAAFDWLLDSFADRYVSSWENRELGRIDSPLYLRSQLEEARELFESARQHWEGFEFNAWGAPIERDWNHAARDYQNSLWDPRTINLAERARLFLVTHTTYDVSKLDQLPLRDLSNWMSDAVPSAVLWASVGMCCAEMAAENCYDLSRRVERIAFERNTVSLAELYQTDRCRWDYLIRATLRNLESEVAEERDCIAKYLGSARAAIALANKTEIAEAQVVKAVQAGKALVAVKLAEQHDVAKRAAKKKSAKGGKGKKGYRTDIYSALKEVFDKSEKTDTKSICKSLRESKGVALTCGVTITASEDTDAGEVFAYTDKAGSTKSIGMAEIKRRLTGIRKAERIDT